MSDMTNLGNPQNNLHDWEEQIAPHVTPIPAEAQADDLFDDTVDAGETPGEIPGPIPGSGQDQTTWNHP